jgi:hypothetical protein
MQFIRRRPARGALAAAALLSLTAFAGTGGLASAAKPPPAGTVTDIASGLAGPLQIEVGPSGTVYAAESFSGTLRLIDRAGNVSDPLAVNPTGEIGGVAQRGNIVAYTTNDRDVDTFEATASTLVSLRKGVPVMTVDLLAYELSNNPDQVNTYGFESISPECAAELPPEIGPANYTGALDSHPYALSSAPDGGWYVAEAGGNAILHVSSSGDVSTVAVLPPQPATVTPEGAGVLDLPDCAIGLTYDFEPVPTDVEVADDGSLYVSTLPGGPEDPSLGARGSVYHVDPAAGTSTLVAGGFAGAVNVAVGGGKVYVSELFANRISVLTASGAKTLAELPSPAGIEWARGQLYVSYNAFGNGTVATVQLH